MPKGLALAYSERVALAVAAPVRAFFIVLKPLIWVLQSASEIGLNLLGLKAPSGEVGVLSEAELKMLLSRSTEEGEIEHEEREMLYNVFDFADKEVSDVMVPRPEVVALAVDMPPKECLKVAVASPFTRYPVYRGSLDDIVGVLHVRDLFRAAEESGGIDNVVIEPLLRTTHVVPETKDLAALLREFRRTKEHMAVVVDEYGAMEGIVTLEDLLEEIVGEIEDEFDLPDESVEKVDEHRIRIHGTFTIDDFNEEFHVSLPGGGLQQRRRLRVRRARARAARGRLDRARRRPLHGPRDGRQPHRAAGGGVQAGGETATTGCPASGGKRAACSLRSGESVRQAGRERLPHHPVCQRGSDEVRVQRDVGDGRHADHVQARGPSCGDSGRRVLERRRPPGKDAQQPAVLQDRGPVPASARRRRRPRVSRRTRSPDRSGGALRADGGEERWRRPRGVRSLNRRTSSTAPGRGTARRRSP